MNPPAGGHPGRLRTERIPVMPHAGPVPAPDEDLDDVEPAARCRTVGPPQIERGQPGELALLRCRHRLDGSRSPVPRSRLDLHEDENVAVEADHIDLAAADLKVTVQQARAEAHQVSGGQAFAAPAQTQRPAPVKAVSGRDQNLGPSLLDSSSRIRRRRSSIMRRRSSGVNGSPDSMRSRICS
jgi:hypothetical protein